MLGKGIVTFLRRFMMRKTGFDVFGQKSSEPRGVDVYYGQWRRVEGGTLALTNQRRTPREFSLPFGVSNWKRRGPLYRVQRSEEEEDVYFDVLVMRQHLGRWEELRPRSRRQPCVSTFFPRVLYTHQYNFHGCFSIVTKPVPFDLASSYLCC